MTRIGKTTISVFLAAAIAGCSPIIENHGYAPAGDQLDRIEIGIDTADSVSRKIGRPSTAGLIRSNNWYYVSSRFETDTYHAPKVTDRRVVAVRFGSDGAVEAIDQFGLEDGRVIDLVTRTTPTFGREMTIMQQLFGNIGNVSAQAPGAAAGGNTGAPGPLGGGL